MAVLDRKQAVDPELIRTFRARGSDLRAAARAAGEADAEDAVQDAMVRTLEATERVEVRDPVRYLFRAVRNAAVDRWRSRLSRAKRETPYPHADAPDDAPGPEREVAAAERLRRVMAVVERMPPRRRAVFLAHRVEELTYAEIALRFGVSRQAVEQHIQLAVLDLKRSGV